MTIPNFISFLLFTIPYKHLFSLSFSYMQLWQAFQSEWSSQLRAPITGKQKQVKGLKISGLDWTQTLTSAILLLIVELLANWDLVVLWVHDMIWRTQYMKFIYLNSKIDEFHVYNFFRSYMLQASRQMLLKLIVNFLNPKSFALSCKLKSIKKNYRAGEEPLKLTFNLQGVDLKQEDIMGTNHTTEVWLSWCTCAIALLTKTDGHH